MGALYLTELANWCRAAGLVTHEMDHWQENARGSGGYDGSKPWCIMWHHTASDTTPENDANYIAWGDEDSPVANVLLDRDGAVWICAGGASNTNGKGGPFTVSRGTIPKDSMNTYAVGIEAANDGVGEPWPQVQIDAYFTLSNMLCDRLGLEVDDICTHQVWAPDRKIDPAQAHVVEGPWQPSSRTSSGTWDLGDVRNQAAVRHGSLPPPDPLPPLPGPPTEDDDMTITCASDTNGTFWIGDGIKRQSLDSMDVFNNYVVLGKSGCYRFLNTSGQVINNSGDVRQVGDLTIQALGVE